MPPELERNKEHFRAYEAPGQNGHRVKLYEIRTSKLLVRGKRWYEMSQREKRKFENLFVLSEPKQQLAFHYV